MKDENGIRIEPDEALIVKIETFIADQLKETNSLVGVANVIMAVGVGLGKAVALGAHTLEGGSRDEYVKQFCKKISEVVSGSCHFSCKLMDKNK